MEKIRKKTDLSVLTVQNVTSTRFVEVMTSGKGWVSYGQDNHYPDYLWGLYTDAPTQQAIIDAKTAFTLGDGIEGYQGNVNAINETLEDVLHKCIFDLHLFGGFAIQVVYNLGGDISELYWADFSKLRISKDGKKIYWCDNWAGYQIDPIVYDAFNPTMTDKTTQIYYFRGASCRSIYPVPCYISAVDAIMTEIEIQHYHLNNIMNGFAASCIVNFNGGVPDEDERRTLEEKINKKFNGSDNAGRTLISWNESKEEACTVEKIESDNFDKKFQQLAKDTQESIFVAHRVTSGTLLGRLPTNTGFTKNEYREAFEVFNLTVIRPYQKQILSVLKKILPDHDITIKPFVIQNNDD
jgi:hypothetical protein